MSRSLTRALVIRCSILAVLGLFAAVGEHFVRDGVELHYELDEIADALAAAVRAGDGRPILEPDPALRDHLAAVPGLRLVVTRPDGEVLFLWSREDGSAEQVERILRFAAQSSTAYFHATGPGDQDVSFGYVATRSAPTGELVRVAAERGPAELRDRLIWIRAELLGEYGPFMLLSTVLSILVVGLTVRRVLRPLDRASAHAKTIVPGHGTKLAVPDMPTEIAPLVEAINGALDRLQDALQRERRFAADVAHTLRTPLAALRARIEGMPPGGEKPGLLRAVGRMERLVEQLLLKARLEAGALDERGSVDLAELVREIGGETAPLLLREGRRLVVDVPEQPVVREVSASAVEQALLNLVDNAAKAAPPGTVVEIRLDRDGTLLVRDRGPGFADPEGATLTAPFRRGRASAWQGAGLGLAIVAEVVRRQGGELVLRNRPGGGAEVGFALPAAGAASRPRRHVA